MIKDEHGLKKALCKELKKLPNTYVTDNLANSMTGRGKPDLIVLHNGYTLYIELKHPNGKSVPREEQKIVHSKIRKAGGYVLVARSIDRVLDALEVIYNAPSYDIVYDNLEKAFGEDGMLDL